MKSFDHLLSEIRNEQVDDQVVAQAGDRVWKSIAGAPAAKLGAHTLRSCDDFQALIPGYLGKQLAPARAMLFDDHAHACVACRHALERARDGERQTIFRLETKRPNSATSSIAWRWGMAASGVAAVAVAAVAFNLGVLPGQHPVRAAVETVDGSLYAGSGAEMRLIPVGYEIRNGDEIRTAKGSTAVVRLLDGSLVEMGERSDLSVSRAWKGTTIHLDGGQVIVQAAKQRTGRLYVATDDGLVSVKGTIFSVNHGIKGSRVAVIEGVVRVDYGDTTTDLQRRGRSDFESQRGESSDPERDRVEQELREISGAAWAISRCCRNSLRPFRGRDCDTALIFCPTFPRTRWSMRRFRILRILWEKPAGCSKIGCSRVRRCGIGGSNSRKATVRNWKTC